jgi:outer membrane protein assembly factor BamD
MVGCGVVRLTLKAILALLVSGCATTLVRGTPKNAEDQYRQALEDLSSGMYPEATQGFTDLKAKYPYSKFASLADLRIADTNFERGKFVEAVDGYRAFLKLHPNHEEAPYSMFRIGEAYYEQIPSDWWFLPPSAEKDQGNTRLAISAFRDFLGRYPTSKNGTDGKRRLNECRRKLADHEMYVARFYMRHEHWVAAAGRAEGIVRDYPSLGLDAEALWISADAHFRADERTAAKASAERLQKDFPGTREAAAASDLLQKLVTNPAPGDTQTPGGM